MALTNLHLWFKPRQAAAPSVAPPPERCDVCRFAGMPVSWDYNGKPLYPCRKLAPIPAHDTARQMGVYEPTFVPRWPAMKGDDWCGDFERAQGDPTR